MDCYCNRISDIGILCSYTYALDNVGGKSILSDQVGLHITGLTIIVSKGGYIPQFIHL